MKILQPDGTLLDFCGNPYKREDVVSFTMLRRIVSDVEELEELSKAGCYYSSRLSHLVNGLGQLLIAVEGERNFQMKDSKREIMEVFWYFVDSAIQEYGGNLLCQTNREKSLHQR